MEKSLEKIIRPHEGEVVKMLVRRHWLVFGSMMLTLFIIFVLPIIVLLIIGVYFPVIYLGITGTVIITFIFAYILFLLAGFLLGYIKYYFDIVIVTNKRIIDIEQRGFFDRNIEELELLHIENITAHVKGAIRTFFDFGDVEVETAAESPNFNFETIPHPQEFSRKVMQLYEELVHEEPEKLKVVDYAEGLARWQTQNKAEDVSEQNKIDNNKSVSTDQNLIAEQEVSKADSKTPYQKQLEQAYKETGVLKEGEEVDLKTDENK